MSSVILISHLPAYYDTCSLCKLFKDIGEIEDLKVIQHDTLLRSHAFIKFFDPKIAKKAASKKDQIIVERSAIRVNVVWNKHETLSTIKVGDLPKNTDINDLRRSFSRFGNIINLAIDKQVQHVDVYVSYSRVEFAIKAMEKMSHSSFLEFVNEDSYNFDYKSNGFEYAYVPNCPWPNNFLAAPLSPSPSPSCSLSPSLSEPKVSKKCELSSTLDLNHPKTTSALNEKPKVINVAPTNVGSHFLLPGSLQASNGSNLYSELVPNVFNIPSPFNMLPTLPIQISPCKFESNNSRHFDSSLDTQNKKKESSFAPTWTQEQQEYGNKFYSILQPNYPRRASKLTGMLLVENQIDNLKDLVKNQKKFYEKIVYFNKILDDIHYQF